MRQRAGKPFQEMFASLKTIGQLRKFHYRGNALLIWVFLLRPAAYTLLRMRNLLEAAV